MSRVDHARVAAGQGRTPRNVGFLPGSPSVRFVAAQPFGGAFVRSYWPAGYLKDLGFDAECDTGWPTDGDVVVIHRPLGRDNLDHIFAMQARGVLVLVSEDDDLTSLHQTKNPHAKEFDLTYNLACMGAADGLIVTTPRLQEVYGPMAKQTYICPNYLPGWVAKMRVVEPHPAPNVVRPRRRFSVRVGWAGVIESHLHDLEWFAPAAREAMEGAMFSCIGDARAPRVLGLRVFETREWAWKLHDLYKRMAVADIGIVPLAPIEFNIGKSWLKALEYMTLGKPVVVTNLPEQARLVTHGSDGFLADTPSEFARYVRLLVRDHGMRERMGQRAQEKAAGIRLENMIDCWYEPLGLRVPAGTPR